MWGAPVSETWLETLDLRRDLYQIRQRFGEQVAAGEQTESLLRAIGARDRLALGELVLGPQALRGDGVVGASLEVVDLLEGGVAPAGLYRRLADLSEHALPVLARACERHPAGDWLVPLSTRIEGAQAGRTHAVAAAAHPAFTAVCWRHAAAGHGPGLVLAAGETGRPEPAMALAAHGLADAAAEAGVRALERDPSSPLLPGLASVWGPDLDPLLTRMIPFLRRAATADALAPHAAWFPAFAVRFNAIRKGLAR